MGFQPSGPDLLHWNCLLLFRFSSFRLNKYTHTHFSDSNLHNDYIKCLGFAANIDRLKLFEIALDLNKICEIRYLKTSPSPSAATATAHTHMYSPPSSQSKHNSHHHPIDDPIFRPVILPTHSFTTQFSHHRPPPPLLIPCILICCAAKSISVFGFALSLPIMLWKINAKTEQ